MEVASGFSPDSRIVEVYWRYATWRELHQACSMDEFDAPRHWGSEAHPWLLLVPAGSTRFAWAYSRTSDPVYEAILEPVRLVHGAHENQPGCLINKVGAIQLAAEERVMVDIEKFKSFKLTKRNCNLENPDVVIQLSKKLKKAHPGSWLRPSTARD